MNKVLLTGGAGFIGYHLGNYLSKKRNYQIHIVDNLSRGKVDVKFKALIRNQNIRFIEADLTDKYSHKLFDNSYDYIYHFSGMVGVKNVIDNPDKVLFVNIISLLNLLEWIKNTQKHLKRLLFSSTSEVYAGTLKHYGIVVPTDERVNLCVENITSPRVTYALSKIVGESACFSYFNKHKIPITIIRYHNVYGPRMGCDHVIPELILKARKSKKYLEVRSVNHTRAFCYISDAIEATIKLAETKNSISEIFNVGNDNEEITMKELAKKIINIVNPALKIKPLDNQVGSPLRRCPNINKIKHTVKFKPEISLDEGLRLTWEWYKEH